MKVLHRLFFCFYFLSSLFILSDSTDTITPNQPLADGKTIISSGGIFELGFFNPDGNPNNRYLGIWYKKTSKVTVVWIANRDGPLNDTYGLLRMTDQAKLTLVSGGNIAIWSSNATRLIKNPVAQLLDTGNLVVKDAADDSPENYIWQSFDYLTDTILPGVKLGLDLVKGIDRYLQSWKSSTDPSKGEFIFKMDPNGFPQEFLLDGSVETFRSGPWNGLRFSGSPGLKPNPVYTYEFVNTPQEIYYRFDMINNSVYSRLTLNANGVLQRLNWNYQTQEWIVYLNAPADNCDAYGLCHAYGICNIANSPVCNCLNKFVPKSPNDWQATDWSSGCVRRVPLDCQKGDGFVKYSGIKLPDTRWSWYNQSMSLEECEKICLKNCTCMAYSNTDIRGKGSGCLLWFHDLIDITELSGSGQDIYIRMASSETGSGSDKAKVIRISLPIVGGVLLLVLGLILYNQKKKKQQKEQIEQIISEGKVGSRSEQGFTNQNDEDDLELPLFDLDTIVQATDNFSWENKLGEGGFGPVYKGTLPVGQEIAVKRLSEYSIQGLEEFKNEVKCIAKLQHRNLVKLLGCCIQAEEKMLIYEFMPNKSLDFFIFDHNRSRLLDWTKRFQIITGVARGLLYLHQDSRLTIIHRDLKAGNILLDNDMKPKISDFGMARIFRGTGNEESTKRVVGTYGYMSPEYAVDGIFSTKSDVYSFGVLVIEIISGRKNRGFCHPDHHHNLLGH
ncbi:hypothetical protein ACH5RR_036609, partial [Cinchona calisaya]